MVYRCRLQSFSSIVLFFFFLSDSEWFYSPTTAFVFCKKCQIMKPKNNDEEGLSSQIFLRKKNRLLYKTMYSLELMASSSNMHSSSFTTITSREQEKGKLLQRPPDPMQFLQDHSDNVNTLLEWWKDKKYVVCLTGAGLSTESGLQDYRGYNGAYHNGHKPMVHDDFMEHEQSRQRYWGRSMVGWRKFDSSVPNMGHHALTKLEQLGKIGVQFDDDPTYYSKENQDDFYFSSGTQLLSILTQNVDSLHRRAGTKYVTELHGRGNLLTCTNCGCQRDRNDFHDELEKMNHEWYEQIKKQQHQEQKIQEERNSKNETHDILKQKDNSQTLKSRNYLRPDGDGDVVFERTERNESDSSSTATYANISIPPCQKCHIGFMKPNVVFFGDAVPKHRVAKGMAAVQASDGLLCIGSSLTVPSAFQFVRYAAQIGVPVAILNVGETRAETDTTLSCLLSRPPVCSITKIEAPAGPTLMACADHFEKKKRCT